MGDKKEEQGLFKLLLEFNIQETLWLYALGYLQCWKTQILTHQYRRELFSRMYVRDSNANYNVQSKQLRDMFDAGRTAKPVSKRRKTVY